MEFEPTKINISASPGNPSTFWKSASGRYYRTKAEAVTDEAEHAVNPEDYVYVKSFWAQNKKTIIWCAVAALLVVGGIWLWKKGRIIIRRQ